MGRYAEWDGPDDDVEMLRAMGYWQAQKNALRGRRGQAFLRELIETLEAMPEKRLASGVLFHEGAACALGQVMVRRIRNGQPVGNAATLERLAELAGEDDEDEARERTEEFGVELGIPLALVRLVAWENDDVAGYGQRLAGEDESAMRWRQMLAWARRNLRPAA